MRKIKAGIAVFAVFFLSGCATFSPSRELFKEKKNINARTYEASTDVCFRALKQVILKKNFTLSCEDKESKKLQSRRFFQKGKRTITIVLNANLESIEENKTTIYLNAIQATEKIYVRSHTRFFLGLIPLPGGGGEKAERLKEGERTIEDKKFYQGFFEEIEGEIKRLKDTGKAGGESE
ncbi:MAG: hypothetical protein J7K37_03730 [Candidatus Omnitrophica bacterium]|nr:hypothetical protein [Candidatus Omnitrophota bacterium]